MANYTEIYLSCELKENVPNEVLDFLIHVVGEATVKQKNTNEPPYVFQAKFREEEDWKDKPEWMYRIKGIHSPHLHKSSGKLIYNPWAKLWYFHIKADVKNYNNELDSFLNWLIPHIETYGHIGHMRYEEFLVPILLFNFDSVRTDIIPDDSKARESLESSEPHGITKGSLKNSKEMVFYTV